MDRYIARANIDHYLSVLSSTDLTERNRETVTKLLIGEEDRFSYDLEQLQFAEDRAARSRDRVNHLRKLRDGFADGSTNRTQADKLLASFEVIHHLTELSPHAREGEVSRVLGRSTCV